LVLNCTKDIIFLVDGYKNEYVKVYSK